MMLHVWVVHIEGVRGHSYERPGVCSQDWWWCREKVLEAEVGQEVLLAVTAEVMAGGWGQQQWCRGMLMMAASGAWSCRGNKWW